MEFTAFSIAITLIVLFIFRSTIRTITKKLPTTADRVVTHLDKTITVNLIEEDLELNKRLVEIEDELPSQIINPDELWNRLHKPETKTKKRNK